MWKPTLKEHCNVLNLPNSLSFSPNAGSADEIDVLRKSLNAANQEARRVRDALDQRRSHTKRIAEEIARNTEPKIATPEEHQLYKTLAEQNRKLVRQLDTLTRKRNTLEKEAKHVKMQIKEVSRAREMGSPYDDLNDGDGAAVRASIHQLRDQYNQTVQWLCGPNKSTASNAIEELRHQYWLTNISVNSLADENARAAEEIKQRTLIVARTTVQLDEAKRYNQSIIDYIESQAHRMVQKIMVHQNQQQQQQQQQKQQC